MSEREIAVRNIRKLIARLRANYYRENKVMLAHYVVRLTQLADLLESTDAPADLPEMASLSTQCAAAERAVR